MNHRLANLDLLRGLAALAVCAGHLRAFLFVDFEQVTSSGIFDRLFYLATGLGHQAVVVFFVLSGYLVGGSVLTAYQAGRWSWTHYALRRMTRLWVVLLPALLLTWALDSLGRHWGHAGYEGAFGSLYGSGPTVAAPADLRASTFLGNALFLQTIAVKCYGTNGPLWSLANEFWYYALFPLACGIVLVTRRTSAPASPSGVTASRQSAGLYLGLGRRALYAVILATLIGWLPAKLVWSGLIWMFGVAAFWVGRRETVRRVCSHPAGLICFGAMALGSLLASKTSSFLGTDFFIGIAFALWIVGLASFNSQLSTLNRLASGLSDMSYTLYVVHFPVLAFVFFCWFQGRQFQPAATGYLWFGALLTATVAFASVVWWCFERNTDRLRKRMEPIFLGDRANLRASR
jgi:peptidoglycan/LPS O-acetylase OafA/YrhL